MQGINKDGAVVVDDMIHSGSFYCDICGQHDLVPSTITLAANYGSTRDGERVTLMVCGDCMDWLFERIIDRDFKEKVRKNYSGTRI